MNLQGIRDKLIGSVADIIDKRVDAKEVGKKLDEELDKRIGSGASEKIQRGLLTSTLLEILEGLWEEEPNSLRLYLQDRYSLGAHQ